MTRLCNIICILFLILGISANSAYAVKTLRTPQGRIGLSYKTEKYFATNKTNIKPEELEKIGSIIKQDEQNRKKNEKLAQKEMLSKIKKEKREKEKARKIAIAKMKEKEILQQKKEKDIEENKKLKAIEAKKQKEAETKLRENEQKKLKIAAKEAEKKQKEEKIKIENKEESSKTNLTKTEKNAQDTYPTEKRKENFFTKLTQKPKQESEKALPTIEQTGNKNTNIQPTKITSNNHKDYETRMIINEVTKELTQERPQMLEELSTLWVSAVQKSDTVYFAIMKLSNPNGDEVNKNGFKKILEPIIGAAPLVGQAFVNPAFTAGSLIGSNVMGTMMNDSATRRLTKVNDADLVILARAIDELQEALLVNYMSYRSAYKEYELSIKIADERKKAYEQLNKQNSPHIILANTFYTEALDNQYKARQDFLMKRVVLEQMVGAEALNEIEKKTNGITASGF